MSKHSIYFDHSKNMTKQSFKDECNINKIMDKFQRTGVIDHYAKHGPTYGDATSVDLQDALNVISHAETMFEELPSSLRKKFENNPQKFLDFVQNSDNLEEMRELGLAKSGPAAPNANDQTNAPTEPAAAPAPNPTAEPSGNTE